MFNTINVQTRKQFDAFLQALRKYEVKVFDTETNGLYPYSGNHLISLSVFFPEANQLYNLPFFHGSGKVDFSWTDKYPEGTDFADMTWQGKLRKQVYLDYWFTQFKAEAMLFEDNYFQNLPSAWLDEVKASWGKGIYIGHNTRFDAHVLYAAGFPDMEMVYDTMIALHLVNEDWKHLQVEAPYTWGKSDAPSSEFVGMWAVDEDGVLLKKEQYANRSLKWQSAHIGFPGATDGETKLFQARRAFQEVLVDFIMEHITDPMNESLLLARVKKGKATVDDWKKQRERIASKIEIDDKAHLWMLPSGMVSDYAGADVVLTWQLYEWAVAIIHQWNNAELFEKQSRIHHFVAWEMERNGFRLDVEAAQAQIALLEPRIKELQSTLAAVAAEYGMEDFNADSPQQLLKFLNTGVLAVDYGTDLFPDWWDVSLTLELKVYPDIRLNPDDTEDGGDELYGTDKRELERVEDHPVVRMVKELRKMNKTVNTYLKKWLAAADANGVVRFSINDDGTVAGRASSSGDAGNGQNIPDRQGYTIKKAIIPYDPSWVLWAADYGQLELRLGAWIGETLLGFDPNMTMTNLFLSGEDMHSYVRDMIDIRNILFPGMTDEQIVVKIGYTLSHEKVNTPEKRAVVVADYLRQVAKTMNFGLLYSGGARMLAKLLKMDEKLAGILVKKWRNLFPAFPKTQEYFTDLAQVRRLVGDTRWEDQYPINPGAAYNYPDIYRSGYVDAYGQATADDLENISKWRTRDGHSMGMYVQQPISGRYRKLHKYKTQAWYLDGNEKIFFNPRAAASRKVWNNTDQGLGGFIAMDSAYQIGVELGRENIKMFANIHDALEGFLKGTHLHLLPEIGKIMTNWPEITPALTVDLQGSKDGTWQGISKIKNMPLWIDSKGREGY